MSTYTEYVPVAPAQQQGFFSSTVNDARGFAARHTNNQPVMIPSGLPPALASKKVIIYSWAASMAIISWDEWHNNKILPRPSRLWYATAFYLMLVVLGISQWTSGIANALAIGYTIMLAWEYFNGTGQFSASGES